MGRCNVAMTAAIQAVWRVHTECLFHPGELMINDTFQYTLSGIAEAI